MYNYSIIIPHRNTPDLLHRLLDSIPQRSDVEIIIVDDNSAGDIVDFKHFPGEKRENTQIIYNKNPGRGAGYARNLGLDVASGEWLLFADADDYYNKDNLNSMLDRFMEDTVTDIVFLNAQRFDENGLFQPHSINRLIKKYLAKEYYSEMYLRYSVWTPWTRMIRHEVVIDHNLRFEEVPAANDKNFCLECSMYSKSIAVEDNFIYYYYRPHTESQTDKKRNSSALDPMISVRTHSNEIYKTVGYKHLLSYFALFHKSLYARDIPFIPRCKKYLLTLKNNNVPLLLDLLRYLKGIVTKQAL